MSVDGEKLLPGDLLRRASLSGNEYAWRIDEIPSVIDAAEAANLINVGGQLQFRLPDGGTCECYWVEVDAVRDMPDKLGWQERVRLTAATAREQFDNLQARYDFLHEGKEAFAKSLNELEAKGGSISDAMCFVWYVDSEESYSNSTIT